MPSAPTLASFALASLVLILLPGPAMLFLVARGVAGGPRAGAFSALGIESATAVYVAATALGLTALLAASTTAFTVVRYAGAVYLVVLGIKTMRDRSRSQVALSASTPASGFTLWRQAFLVGIGNPKTALFFLAFFPQFIHPEAGPVASQVLVLGAVTIAIGTVLDLSYGLFGGFVRRRLNGRPSAMRRGRVAVGLTYLGLGGLAAITGLRAA